MTMKTRRKSKTSSAAAVELEAEAGSSQPTEEISPSVTFNIPLPDDLDFDALGTILPDVSLTSPSADAIILLYKAVLSQASQIEATQRELDDARAEAERKDVELDQALQDRESLTKDLDGSLERVQAELNRTKQARDALAASHSALQTQIATLSTSQSSSSSELDHIRRRVDDTEREKRDLIAVIDRLKQDAAQRDEEVQTLRANLKEARQENQALEAQTRDLRSIETSTKFKVESLSQQLQLSQAEAERSTSELMAKSDEFAKYRRTKHAEFVQLQASHDALTQTHASMESTLKIVQSAHNAQGHQLKQALARVQDLTGQLAEQEATYSSEASGLRRLVSMMEEREKRAKEIVEGIEREWAGVGDRAERREMALAEEIESERRARELAEKRVEQLETVLSRMDSGELPVPGRVATGLHESPAWTPGPSHVASQGMMSLSPTVAMASKAQRGGKTFTEVYADYIRLQDDYAKKSAEYDQMDRTLSAVLAQIEERAPILSQQRVEYERLQSEASLLASQLNQALADRDIHATMAKENTQKLSKSVHESQLLQKQLDDLGRQVQVLLKDIARRDDPTIPPDDDLDQLRVPPAENVEAVITNNLVLFHSIGGLQVQNQKLLKIVRELGAKLEAEEKDYREAIEKEQGEAVREAHEAIQELAAQLERQKKSSEVTIQAYMKERDTLRSMLNRSERTAAGGGSITNGDMNGFHEGAGTGVAGLAKELSDTQSQFQSYRTEMDVDSGRLREEVVQAQRETGQLSTALAKANAKIEYLNDRLRLNQEDYSMQARELDNLRKRNQQLDDQYMRADIACNHATEDLIVAKGQMEQLRNECANLRAEKKIWESVQNRLVEENRALAVERSHLSDLMSNVQKMHNDLERSGENDRRRLESQIQMLDNQVQDLKVQLTQERDSIRHVSLQKEIEVKELQTRLETLSQELSKTRESLVGAETSKKHLEERVEGLMRQLQGNQEKLAVYERRPGLPGVTHHVESDLTREQQLEAEVAELRSALKVAELDLATARSHVQQFQEISQANESALATMTVTHDEYKAATEVQLARLESDHRSIREKLEQAQQEMALQKAKHQEAQQAFDAERTDWLNDKNLLESSIADLSILEKQSEGDRTSRETAVREYEERVKAAEERYTSEVVAHAESIKVISTLRQQFADSQTSLRDNIAAAETAQANLSTSEGSWKRQRDALSKEIADLNTRCKDLASSNSSLIQHLEEVSSQAARIRQASDATAIAISEEDAAEDSTTKHAELRSVVVYLRREKEIVDLQLELGKQENARLKIQVEHLSLSLQEVRTTLAEEREKAAETAGSEAQHTELMDKINQLNILRESNATLRSECANYAKKSRELEVKLQQLSKELEPAREQARLAQAELEARDAQVKRLEEECRRWQERNIQLLSKYERIDPADMQALKDEIEQLKAQKDEQEAHLSDKSERIEALEANLRNHKESYAKNMQGFKTRLGVLNTEKSKLNADIVENQNQIKALTMERDALRTTVPSDSSTQVAQQVETLHREKAALEKALAEEKAAKVTATGEQSTEQGSLVAALRAERDKLLAEKEAAGPGAVQFTADSMPEDAKRLWEAEKAELVKVRDDAAAQLKAALEQAKNATEEAKSIRLSNEKFQTKIHDLQKARAADAERAAAQQEAQVKAAVENVKTQLQPSNVPSVPEDVSRRHTDELRALESRLVLKHQAELKSAVDAAVAAEKEAHAAVASQPAADHNGAIAAAIAAHDKELQTRHAEEIASAVERGRMEQATKGKIKDAQLVKSQKRVKELEQQILEWRKSGLLPESSAAATTATPATSASPAVPTTSTVPATQRGAQPTPATSAAATTPLPRKPSLASPTTPVEGVGTGVGRGVRGVVRGVRGGARGLNIRGAAPGRGGAPTSATTSPAASGVSIIGAATKRSREEGDSPDDSLVKRIKPVEGGSGQVTLRRPPPP